MRLLILGGMMLAGALFSGCHSNQSDSSESEDDPTADTLEIDSLNDLELSDALAIDVPDPVLGEGDGVTNAEALEIDTALVASAREKSAEACNVRSKLRSELGFLALIATDVCFAESEMVGQDLDGKYEIEDEEGDRTQIWVDRKNSGDKVRIFFCKNEVLDRMFVLTAADGNRSKGSFTIIDEETNSRITGKFDKYFSNPDLIRMTTKSATVSDDTTDFVRIGFNLSTSGVSTVFSSDETLEGDSYSVVSSVMRIGQKIGSILQYHSSSEEDVDAEAVWYKSYVDNAGNILSKENIASSLLTKALKLGPKLVPRGLGRTFAIDDLPENELWDCQGTQEVDTELHNAAYDEALARCDLLGEAEAQFADEEDCDGGDFTQGETVDGIDATDRFEDIDLGDLQSSDVD